MNARAAGDSRALDRHPLHCRCGTLQGHVRVTPTATRALCYCRDCQAYARFLGSGFLDHAGGTEVVAMQPANVRFDAGLEALACLSLSPRGILRWYAQCCRTPVGNTPRDPRIAYVGMVQACLGDEPARRASFGPVRLAVNGKSASGHVAAVPRIHAAVALCNLGASLLAARISGRYRQTPFFDVASGQPVRSPRILAPAERAQAYRDTA